MRFTDRSIASLKPKAKIFEVWEDGRTGLGVRMSPKGRKSWNYMFRFDSKARRMTLGTYPAVSLASAQGAASIFARRMVSDPFPGERSAGPTTRGPLPRPPSCARPRWPSRAGTGARS